jgi:dimethylargininase
MWTALTRKPGQRLGAAKLTFLPRQEIDCALALRQHADYERSLEQIGVGLVSLPAVPEYPDSVFVEDGAVVLDEVAVIARPGVESRRGETASLAAALAPFRELRFLSAPATLEGGDVLRAGKTLYVGVSGRTSLAGIGQLADLLRPYDHRVEAVEVRGCLHLKTACSLLPDGSLLVNPEWIDVEPLRHRGLVEVPPEEPWGANVLAIGEIVLAASSAPRTCEKLAGRCRVTAVDISEFQKAEAGVTCMSLVFQA